MPNRKNTNEDNFTEAVLEYVRSIPCGETRSYKEVAEAVRRPRAARAVAMLMSRNYDISVPCHRVIRSDGTVGGYNRGGETVKKDLLLQEGVIV